MTKTITARNFKGVREITLTPSGALVVIAGANGAGKSSLIDAMTELFAPKGVKLTPRPIREGTDEAYAEYTDTDLGVKISRTWKKNDAGKLEVQSLDGAKYSKPTELIAELTGGLLWDPVAFLQMDERKQRDALLEKVDLPFDLDALARDKAGAEQRRLEAGREVKRLEGALASLPKPEPGTPDEEISGQDILDEIEKAQRANRDREGARADYDLAAERYDALTAQIEELQRKREEVGQQQENALLRLKSMPEEVDVTPLRERLATVDETNRAVRAARQHLEVSGELQVADADHAAAQAELDRIAAKKAEGLAAAKFPVDGLSVTDDGVTFRGIPFSQVNSAMRRRIAFAIATAGDPKLKLVIVKDGDLLDSESLQGIADLADERGYTVLVERDRDESRRIGFTVRDGVLDDGLPPIEDVAAAAGLNVIPVGGAR